MKAPELGLCYYSSLHTNLDMLVWPNQPEQLNLLRHEEKPWRKKINI